MITILVISERKMANGDLSEISSFKPTAGTQVCYMGDDSYVIPTLEGTIMVIGFSPELMGNIGQSKMKFLIKLTRKQMINDGDENK